MFFSLKCSHGVHGSIVQTCTIFSRFNCLEQELLLLEPGFPEFEQGLPFVSLWPEEPVAAAAEAYIL